MGNLRPRDHDLRVLSRNSSARQSALTAVSRVLDTYTVPHRYVVNAPAPIMEPLLPHPLDQLAQDVLAVDHTLQHLEHLEFGLTGACP